ncbi:hypothetical protein AVEN_196104-1 [Araneus ventricosus]|uniref:Uncharacterized protein n=1 Tax=Araneus ventricosus TaxID=182803 RepID=A0A4Y2HKB9_ARAVE|nr:hypothetical protein AVEN_196104-1 [Araneus ventricosus]
MILDIPAGISIFKSPCYSESVERCIKLVTKASAEVCGSDARDEFIRSRIASRIALPKLEIKSRSPSSMRQLVKVLRSKKGMGGRELVGIFYTEKSEKLHEIFINLKILDISMVNLQPKGNFTQMITLISTEAVYTFLE